MRTQSSTSLASAKKSKSKPFSSLKELNSLKAPFTLAPLPFGLDDLDSAIDRETLLLHHGKHHRAYVNKLNDDVEGSTMTIGALFEEVSHRPKGVRNNGGGHWNHSFFWSILSGDARDHAMPNCLKADLEKSFGTVGEFKKEFEKAAATRFGSGWAWLIRDKSHKLKIISTPNQDNPLMDVVAERGQPLLCVDVWEHAYYLKFHSRREDWLKSFWSVVNWKAVDAYDHEIMHRFDS